MRLGTVSGAGHRTRPGGADAGAKLSYIPALDGVRGVAMIVIMGYHGGVFLTNGGFYSLDTFFALSGFLITSLLIAEWRRSSTIRLRAFWARRARRLVPGLLVLLLGVALYNAYLVPAGMYPHLRSDGLSTLFYFANWHFIAIGSNYFNQTGFTSPLLHTWSLAVEEQFYLIWPLAFLVILKLWRSLRVLLVVCVAGALASSIEMAVLYSPANVNRVYYGTDTRAQALLVGAALSAALALWADRRTDGEERRTNTRDGRSATTRAGRTVLLAIGLLGVLGSAALWILVSFNDAFAFRGGFLLASLATTAVLWSVSCSETSPLARCLSFAPLRYIGRISYGMYLWHFPLFLYVDHARTGLSGFSLFGVRAAATVAIATVSYYVVERPIRQGGLLRGWRSWVATPAALTVTIVSLVAATSVPVAAATTATTSAPVRFKPPKVRTTGIYAGPTVKLLLVGDSTAETMAIGLSAYSKDYDIRVRDGGILGCGVTSGSEAQLKGIDIAMDPRCNGSATTEQWPQIWQGRISAIHPNVVMILAGRWEVTNRTYQGRWTNILQPSYAAYVKRQLRYAVKVASSEGADVVLLTAPCFDTGEQPDGQGWPEDSAGRLAVYNRLVREVGATSPHTSVINFNAMACPAGHYQKNIEGVPARYDGVHFTLGGGVVFESRIFPTVVRLARQQMARATN